ncbi:MAG: phospholipase D-like domain-containing protein [Candidatus Micrarchaeota archaeon]|nr:phospholipase D-like domain-containing protein [Candidatus Micrarchaeota archaeon]
MGFQLKTLILVAVAAFAAGAFLSPLLPAPASQANAGPFTALALFSPNGAHCVNGSVEAIISPPAEKEMVAAVSSARETLDILLFQFSSTAMKEAVVNALGNGARVRIILEPRVDANLETAAFLKEKGADARWATTDFAYTHAKLAIIDGRRVLVGSINWSKNALTKNREAEVLVDDAALAREFQQVFEEDWAEATPVK